MIGFKAQTVDKDFGWKALLAEIDLSRNSYVDIGIFEGEKHPDSELTLAQIGAVHEFGSWMRHGRSGGATALVPPRPWLRRTEDEKRRVWRERMDNAIARLIDGRGKIRLVSLLTAFGEKAASDVRRTITAIKDPPKAPSTLRREGARFTNPLIWFGYMRAAVRSRIVASGQKRMTEKGTL